MVALLILLDRTIQAMFTIDTSFIPYLMYKNGQRQFLQTHPTLHQLEVENYTRSFLNNKKIQMWWHFFKLESTWSMTLSGKMPAQFHTSISGTQPYIYGPIRITGLVVCCCAAAWFLFVTVYCSACMLLVAKALVETSWEIPVSSLQLLVAPSSLIHCLENWINLLEFACHHAWWYQQKNKVGILFEDALAL